MLAQNGIQDILIAYQMVGPNVNRFVSLQRQYPNADFKVVVDHTEAVSALSAEVSKFGLTVKVMLDLDVGMNRTGIPVGDAAVDVYAQIEAAEGLQTSGLHVYDGHIHDEDVADRKASCDESLAQVAEMQDKLAAKGLDVPLIVMGGTPDLPDLCGDTGGGNIAGNVCFPRPRLYDPLSRPRFYTRGTAPESYH